MTKQFGWWFFTCGNQVLVIPQGERIPYGDIDDLPVPMLDFSAAERFASYKGEACLRLELPEVVDMGMGEWLELRTTMSLLNAALFNLVGKAQQFALFLQTHKFCGRCGNALVRVDWELAMQCDHCGFRAYPRISPSIIVLITDGNKVLLANHRRHQKQDMPIYTAIAGFVEAGETLEQTVHRETREETGLKVKNVQYWKSQPWAFPHSLMAAYFADYAEGEINIDRRELADAQWFDASVLPHLPPPGTIARDMINHWLSQQTE
ncbi:NAD(+) diphosphatase [Agarivorans sp. TSD2052]|uniref:NAD(+) diphosphatase n=1 Tax=Agarivorans sp. TSD2052 TaxID=2937286 RepID=UPI00200F7AD9|nr:NAD(+) diphosphatase [Agarivorans sp. TSD2052]UPW18161.1 NAD(+) diphosphatase [Agarivorans sp. TSD2052]